MVAICVTIAVDVCMQVQSSSQSYYEKIKELVDAEDMRHMSGTYSGRRSCDHTTHSWCCGVRWNIDGEVLELSISAVLGKNKGVIAADKAWERAQSPGICRRRDRLVRCGLSATWRTT